MLPGEAQLWLMAVFVDVKGLMLLLKIQLNIPDIALVNLLHQSKLSFTAGATDIFNEKMTPPGMDDTAQAEFVPRPG